MSSGYFRTSSGGSLATLDINSDGLGDLLIGSIDVTTDIGSVIAILGDAGGFDATFDLNVADGSNSVILDGATAGSEFSWDIANIGNVNGGGADDFAIVSRADGTVRVLLDPNSADAGYTVTGIIDVFSTPSSGITITGLPTASEQISVVGLGDVNNDKIGDFAISSADVDGGNGAVYVVYGSATPILTLDVSELDGSNGFTVSGAGALNAAGTAITGSDFNGDLHGDLVFSMPAHDSGGTDAGRVVVLFGNPSTAFPSIVDIDLIASTNPDETLTRFDGVVIDGFAALDMGGTSIAGTGDFNGDGKDDLLIAAPNADPNGSASGTVYLVYGDDSAALDYINLATPLEGPNFVAINGTAAGGMFGRSVANLGDVTGDGTDNIGVLAANGDLFLYDAIGAVTYSFANIFAIMPETLELAGIADINSDAGGGINDIAITATFFGGTVGETVVILGGNANFAALDAADGATDDKADFASITAPVDFVQNSTTIFVTGEKTATTDEDNTGSTTGAAIGVSDTSNPAKAIAPTFANAGSSGALGVFVVDAAGALWSYSISDNAVLQNLDDGDSITDEASLIANNGATQTVTVTINGLDDAPAFTGDTTLNVSEDHWQSFGYAQVADVDEDDTPSISGVTAIGQHGHIVFGQTNGAGDTSYTYFLTDASAQDLNDANILVDNVSVIDSEKNTHTVVVNINGVTDGTSSVDGDADDNTLLTSYGDDVINGAGGADLINGGAGDDQQNGDAGHDTIFDALGNDTANGGDDHDSIQLLSGNNTVAGGNGSDFIQTGFQQDIVDGGSGNDVIAADAGAVFLFGNDRVTGGSGDDLISAGSGIDTFVFRPNEGVDTIAKFSSTLVSFDGTTGYSGSPQASDFELGIDKIELSGFVGVDAGNVMTFISDAAGHGAQFVAEGTTINIYNVLTSGLDSDDFIFV